jgi:hypothetical protein
MIPLRWCGHRGSEDDDGLVKEVREEYHSKKRLLDGSLENVLRDMNAL